MAKKLFFVEPKAGPNGAETLWKGLLVVGTYPQTLCSIFHEHFVQKHPIFHEHFVLHSGSSYPVVISSNSRPVFVERTCVMVWPWKVHSKRRGIHNGHNQHIYERKGSSYEEQPKVA